MTIYAQSVVRRVVDTIQDMTSIRWPLPELVRYFNDGQREIAMYRPDAMVTNTEHALVTGSKQTIPANGSKLIEIVRNATGNKRAVRLTNREILDAQAPGWHGMTAATEILHYMFDPRDPRTFYVYPPANSSASLQIVYSAYPTDIAIPTEGAALPTDTSTDNSAPTVVIGVISVRDTDVNALQDYMLYRAFTKDSEYAGNSARAQNHYAAFANALGIEIKATIQVAPASSSNPNIGGTRAAG